METVAGDNAVKKQLKENNYIDNIMGMMANEDEAIKIMEKGQFPLAKWKSNIQVLNDDGDKSDTELGTSAGGRTSLQRNVRTYFYLTWSLFFLISSFLVNARFQFWSCFKEHLLRKIIILFSFSWKDRKDINWRSSSSQSLTSNQITRGQGE